MINIIPLLSSVLRNFLSVLNGYDLNVREINLHNLAEEIIQIKKNGGFSNEVVYEHYREFFQALERYEKFKEVFLRNLIRTLEPKNFGIERTWKKTQFDALRAIIYAIQEGFTRPVSEIPTGGGKSMVLGAIARAYYDTLIHFKMEREIVLVTSRVNLVDQLIDLTLDEENVDKPLNIGDVRIWFVDFPESAIRILAGKTSNSQEEIAKDSKITIVTYHGVTPERITQQFPRQVGLVLLDECHRVTERVMMCLNQWHALFFGYSATVIGAQIRNPFQFFDPIVKTEEDLANADSHTELFAYFKSVIEMIRSGELKPVRWLNVKTNIDLSGAATNGSLYSQWSIFNEQSVSKILTRYAEAGYEVIREAYLGENGALTLTGSKPVIERIGLVSVHRIALAEYYVKRCNEELLPELQKKYGQNVRFKSGYVDGKMEPKQFKDTMAEYRRGEITLMFTSEKISEGEDVPGINMVIILRALGLGSQWKLKQFLGRGTRINSASPDDDLLVVDGVFQSKRHNLASVFGILGQTSAFSGGILLGSKARTELENKIFTLLNYGVLPDEIPSMLTEEELILFQKLNILNLKPKHSVINHHDQKISPYLVKKIDFVEREDVKFNLALDNPKELARLVMIELEKQGCCSEKSLRSFQSHLLIAFQQQMFGRLGRGVDIVNLITGRNETSLRDKNYVFDEFIKKLVFHGMPFTGNGPVESLQPDAPMIDKDELVWKDTLEGNSIDELVSFCRDKFGLDPEFSTTNRAFPIQGWTAQIAMSQVSFRFGDYQVMSKLHTGITKDLSRKLAAQELFEILIRDWGISESSFYHSFPELVLRVKGLWKLLGKHKMKKVQYVVEITENQLYSCVAFITKGNKITQGKLGYHRNEEMAKVFALSNLFEVFHEKAGFPDIFQNLTTPVYETMVVNLCKERNIVVEYDEQEINPPYALHSCTARVIAPGRKPLNSCEGIDVYKATAREYTSKHLYNLLIATNYPDRISSNSKTENEYWDRLNKLKIEKSFKVESIIEKIAGSKNLINVFVKVKINRNGTSTVFESRIFRTGVKNAGLNKAAAELIPQIKNHFKLFKNPSI